MKHSVTSAFQEASLDESAANCLEAILSRSECQYCCFCVPLQDEVEAVQHYPDELFFSTTPRWPAMDPVILNWDRVRAAVSSAISVRSLPVVLS